MTFIPGAISGDRNQDLDPQDFHPSLTLDFLSDFSLMVQLPTCC